MGRIIRRGETEALVRRRGVYSMPLVVCSHCGAKVRADRIDKHVANVHPTPGTAPAERSKKRRKRRREGGSSSPVLPSTFTGSSMREWDFD